METTGAVKLVLRPGNVRPVTMSLTGKVHNATRQGLRRLLSLTWARLRPLRVAFSADDSGNWCWPERAEALADLVGGSEILFSPRGCHAGR